jgi:uncharacterized protein YegL
VSRHSVIALSCVIPLGAKRAIVKAGGLESSGLAWLNASGGTALWDAVVASIGVVASNKGAYDKSASGNKTRRCKVVLLTDGADQHSNTSHAAACEKVRKPGCVVHFILIAVGADRSTLQQLEQLCAPGHARLVTVQDASKMKDSTP